MAVCPVPGCAPRGESAGWTRRGGEATFRAPCALPVQPAPPPMRCPTPCSPRGRGCCAAPAAARNSLPSCRPPAPGPTQRRRQSLCPPPRPRLRPRLCPCRQTRRLRRTPRRQSPSQLRRRRPPPRWPWRRVSALCRHAAPPGLRRSPPRRPLRPLARAGLRRPGSPPSVRSVRGFLPCCTGRPRSPPPGHPPHGSMPRSACPEPGWSPGPCRMTPSATCC